MNFRFTAILFGVVTVLVVGLLVAALMDDSPPADAALLDLNRAKPEEIDTVELIRTEPTEQRLVFVRIERDNWELREPTGPRVEGFQVSSLVRDLLQLRPTTFSDMPAGPSEAGLNPATLKVTLKKGGERSATLLIGDTTIGKDKAVTFVATGERPTVPVAVRRADLSSLFKPGTDAGAGWQLAKWLPDYRSRRLLGADLRDPLSDLKAVQVSQGQGDQKRELGLARTEAGDWTFTAPPTYGPADLAGDPQAKPEVFTGVRPLVNFLTGLSAAGPEAFIENPGPLEQYGLNPDNPNVLRIELVPQTGKPDVLLIGNKVDEQATPTQVYAKVPTDPAVVKLQTDRLDALRKTVADPNELRDRTLVPDTKKEAIDAVEVVLGGQTAVKLRRVDVGAAREWVLYGGPTDPQIAAPAAKDLIDALTRPRAAREVFTVPQDAAFAEPEVQAVVKLWYDGIEPAKSDDKKDGEEKNAKALPPEPTLKGDPSVTLTFGRKEVDSVYVRRVTAAGQIDLKVPEELFRLAARNRLAYLDPKLKGFPTTTATRVVFNRGPENFELVKDQTPDPQYPLGKWTFAQPERLQGQVVDTSRLMNDVLSLLATQTASRVVAETPSPEDLKTFGLDPANPVMKITVTLDTEEDKDRVFLFGTETVDKQAVHAMQPDRPLVFTVPKFVFDQLMTTDLRDLTLYRIDPKQVQGIRLRGWKQAAGQPVEYVFERKDDTWVTAKSPAPFTPDPAKLDALAAALAAPKPVRSTGGGPLPEHGFDMLTAENPLEITLTVDGHPPIALTIGEATNGGQYYYVWCITRKDEVMVLPAASLRPYKETPDYLKR